MYLWVGAESNKVPVKIDALKTAILMLLSGEKLPSLLMVGATFFLSACVCVCVCVSWVPALFFCLAWLGLVWLTLEFVNRCVLCRCCAFSSSQSVIRYVMPFDDHTLKKLLLVFWEIVPKYDASGKLLQEMILVCDAYRKVGFNHGFVFVCL